MTTTQTNIRHCDDCEEEVAIAGVFASHFDPDADEDGRAIGWSRRSESILCEDCLQDWENDDLSVVHETWELT